MFHVFRENIGNYISRYYIQLIQSFLIMVADIVIVLGIFVSMTGKVTYTPDQLSYNIMNEKIGYVDSGSPGVFSYGPYINLRKGSYRIEIHYETDTDTEFDICYKDEDSILLEMEKGTLGRDSNSKKIVIFNERLINNASFEVRTYYPGTGYLQINSIVLRQCFHIDKYVVITMATFIISMLFLCGKRVLTIWERPGEVLCFGCFYTVTACLCLYSMTFLIGGEKMWLHCILNALIVLHAYGNRKGIYDDEAVVHNILSAVCYVFLFGSFCWIDKVMQGIISRDARAVYADNTPYIFTCSIAACLVFIVALIRKLWLKRVLYGITYYVLVVLLAVQYIYYQVFSRLFSFKDMQLAGEGGNYSGYILSLINGKFWFVFVPLILIGVAGIYLMRYTAVISREWKIAVCSVIVSVILYSHTIFTKDYGEWNSFDNDNFIYETMNDRVRAFKLCGFYQYELRDLKKTVLRDLVRNDEDTEEVAAYFVERAVVEGGNSMTGIFEGKNVIFVLMESIGDFACREDVMPTLYKMSKEGIHFSNMYAPIYGSAATINSETVTNIGYYAPLDGSMIYSYADNSFPDSLASRFADAGYAARQYHFNTPGFYDRATMNRTFGYQEYVSFMENTDGSAETGIDTILIEDDGLYGSLIQDEKFFDYVISYTAHLPYDVTDNLVRIALERHPEYNGMTYSEEMNYYFAKARITDDMFSGLIQRLEQDGLLENTVIVAVGDHYPYGMADKRALYDFSGVEGYEQLLCKVPCVIWTPGMEAVEVDKIAGSVDLLPTIVNLMGLGDCSVYVGHDIFDDSYEGYAYFSDGSWIAGDSYYYQGRLVYGTMDVNGITDMNQKVMETITVNDDILHTNYWYGH